MLANKLWVFIRNCNQYESKNKDATYEYIEDLKKVQSYWTCARKLRHNSKVTDLRISDRSLIEVLDENKMLPHPFRVQCL
jgi:hypothetical protein